MQKTVLWICFFIGIFVVVGLGAQAAEKKLPVTQASVQQKLAYSKNLVNRGKIAKAIIDGQDSSAIAILETSKGLLHEAENDINAGQHTLADEKINKALAQLRALAPKVIGSDAKKERRLKTYDTRRQSVMAFLNAYERVSKEKKLGAPAVSMSRQIKARVKKSDAFVKANNIVKGQQELEKAYVLVTTLTAELREGATLIRELNFETPKHEYIYEIDRNDSLSAVLIMTLTEKKTNPNFLLKIKELRQSAETIRKQAEQQADAGDYKGAIELLGKSAKDLIKAVRMGGLYIPG